MLDPDKIYKYFDENHGPLEKSTNGWYEAECPYCRTKKLYVQPDKGYAKCYKGCFWGTAVNFVAQYLGSSYFEAYSIIDDTMPGLRVKDYMDSKPAVSSMVLPEGYHRILSGNTPMAKRARTYLKQRDFDLNYLDMIGVGYSDGDDYFGYIIIPFKRNGEVVYFIGRDYMNRGDKFRYKNPPASVFGVGKSDVLFNEEALYLYNKIYLTEGWADAASLGNNGVSLQGKSMSLTQWDLIASSPAEEVVIVSDLGAEMEALNMLERLYKRKKTKLIKLTPLKEFGKDVNAIGADRVLRLEPQTPHITTLEDFYHEARSINPRKTKLLN